MLDSSTKHPENRIHLYDPVGLINEGYSGYKPSNYTLKPRRQTVSYDSFIHTNNTTNNNISLKSYNSVTDAHSLKSFDSFEVDSFTLRSYHTETNSFEATNGHRVSSSDRNDGGLRFVIGENVIEDDQLDAPTPRLWRPSSVTSPKSLRSRQSPKESVNFSSFNVTNSAGLNSLNSNQQTMSMSANSRTQAIARGRKELMDMVRDLPESFYELSLKDIVEQKAVETAMKKEADIPEEKKVVNEIHTTTTTTKNNQKEMKKQKSSKKVKKSESKKKMVRSKSVDNGKFLLKTSVFPILGSRKSKKSMNVASSFKVAPMPKPEQTSNGPVKAGEKEWWRRKSCMSSDSDKSNGLSSQSTSSRSSSSSNSNSSRSNSSNGRRGNRFLPSCCIFNGRRVEGKR